MNINIRNMKDRILEGTQEYYQDWLIKVIERSSNSYNSTLKLKYHIIFFIQ